MMKSCKPMILVDSVENAIKFYTEKLGFDIVDLVINKEENKQALAFAHLRKGKCFVIFQIPKIEELAEFSFIKRCASRCVGMFIEMKKGLDKYYAKLSKKGLNLSGEPTKNGPFRTFSLKDPFGIKVTFAEPIEGFPEKPKDFAGIKIDLKDSTGQTKKESVLQEEMIKHLKTFGILRRAAKKYSKLWIKEHTK